MSVDGVNILVINKLNISDNSICVCILFPLIADNANKSLYFSLNEYHEQTIYIQQSQCQMFSKYYITIISF